MKVNPYGRKVLKLPNIVRDFKDSLNEESIHMEFRRLGPMNQMAAANEANTLCQRYLWGIGEEGKPGYVPPMALPPIDGEAVVASEDAFQAATILWLAQVVAQPEDKYSPEDIISFMTSPEIFFQMAEVCRLIPIIEGEEFSGGAGSAPFDSKKPEAA